MGSVQLFSLVATAVSSRYNAFGTINGRHVVHGCHVPGVDSVYQLAIGSEAVNQPVGTAIEWIIASIDVLVQSGDGK